VILSDPTYRGYLADAVDAQHDRSAEVRRDRVAKRFQLWDRRIFGHPLRPEQVSLDLERVLLDRPLESFPVALRTAPELEAVCEPFLDVWEQAGLAICLPPHLVQLRGGVAGVNRILRATRMGTEVGVPELGHRPSVYHGGILHPGEPLPRAVPDLRSLRLRVAMQAPFASLLAALMLLQRQYFEFLSVSRSADGWEVRWRSERIGGLLEVLETFGTSRGWVVCRHSGGGLRTADFVEAMEVLGITNQVGRHLVLAERFFVQLVREVEEQEVYARLRPLAAVMEAWLDHAVGREWEGRA
jgi:hypothetical protein